MSSAVAPAPEAAPAIEPKPVPFVVNRRFSDRAFRGVLIGGALTSFVVLTAIFGYLFGQSAPIFREYGWNFVFGSGWYLGDSLLPSQGSIDPPVLGLFPMLWGSILIALIAIAIGVPIAVLVSLAIVFYLPSRISQFFTSVVDLAAAIPSLIYGIWGLFVLVPYARYWAALLNKYFSWIPIFDAPFPSYDQSPFIAGLVLGVMIIPIVASVSREVFSQTPPDYISGALALGATRFTLIRNIVLPFGKGGIVGGAMLGLGRALGETIAVFFVLVLVYDYTNWYQVLFSEGGSIASLIAAQYGEATELGLKALFGAGLVLFFVTLLANFAASGIIAATTRKKS